MNKKSYGSEFYITRQKLAQAMNLNKYRQSSNTNEAMKTMCDFELDDTDLNPLDQKDLDDHFEDVNLFIDEINEIIGEHEGWAPEYDF